MHQRAAGDAMDRKLSSWLSETGVRFLRIAWVDNAGVLRANAVRATRVSALADDGIPVISAAQAVPVYADEVQAGLGIGAVGGVWLKPDLDTLRVVPWEPTHASVLGSFVDREGAPWAFCPRAALERAVARLAGLGLELQAGYEHEFLLLRHGGDTLSHFESSHYASARGLDRGGPVLDSIAEALEAQGVPVLAMLKEAGLSQFEIVSDHGSPVQAANRFLVARETIAAVAHRNELVGTCLPKVYADEAGNGWHLHFSLWRGADNITGRGRELDPEAAAFVAGVLDHLPALLALTTPSANSFRRKQPGAWAGAYRIWGYDHKESPLRVPTERHGAPTNVELKASDATANPFLALAGLIAAGVDGIERKLALPAPTDVDPGTLGEAEREARGFALLPEHPTEALDLLEADAAITGVLGEPLTRAYLAVKRAEVAHFSPLFPRGRGRGTPLGLLAHREVARRLCQTPAP